jgi:hypothetical protein
LHTGLFPEYIPGTRANIHFRGRLISKHADKYVRALTHAPDLINYTIDRSDSTLRDCQQKWTRPIFDNIDWAAFNSRFTALSSNQRFRIAKYVHDWTPTLRHQNRVDNSVDHRCFVPECSRLWDDANHIFQCRGTKRSVKRTQGIRIIRETFASLYTPPDMSESILKALTNWMHKRPVCPPRWTYNTMTPLRQAIRHSFDAQTSIGWDQFLRGRLTTNWKTPLALYYKARTPDSQITPTLWMTRTIDAMWTFFSSMWDQRNADFFGGTRDEIRAKALEATRTNVRRLYSATQGQVTPRQTRILHRLPIAEILTWTKTHLDAYLATAEIFLDQNIAPG